MRYSKAALLIFGLGMVGGLMIVSAELPRWGWTASAAMAAGLLLIPVGLVVDLRRSHPFARLAARVRRRKPVRKAAARSTTRRKRSAPARRPPKSRR